MYSVVMMMALTTGADLPACHRRHGCEGSCGGCAVASCSGGCYGGCDGGGCHHRHRLFHRGHGCHGGCYGAVACSGGYACSGAVISTGCYGGAGCAGSWGGCSGGVVAPGGMYYGAPVMPGAGSTLPPPTPGKGGKKGGPTTQAPTTGTIVVSLPADARLTVDGRPTASNSTSRVLETPDLQPGYEYYYTLRAEIVRDGRTVAQTQQVAVHPGEQSRVSFDFASGGVASNR